MEWSHIIPLRTNPNMVVHVKMLHRRTIGPSEFKSVLIRPLVKEPCLDADDLKN